MEVKAFLAVRGESWLCFFLFFWIHLFFFFPSCSFFSFLRHGENEKDRGEKKEDKRVWREQMRGNGVKKSHHLSFFLFLPPQPALLEFVFSMKKTRENQKEKQKKKIGSKEDFSLSPFLSCVLFFWGVCCKMISVLFFFLKFPWHFVPFSWVCM